MTQTVDDELHRAIEKGHEITEMQATPGWAALQHEVAAVVEAKQRHVLSGTLNSNQYLSECGFIRGLSFFLGMPEQVNRQIRELREQLAELRDQ